MDHDERRFLAFLFIGGVVALIVLALLAVGPCFGDEPPSRRLFDALWRVEASGQLNPLDGAAGEIGPYQIKRCYWLDARMPDGTYQDCRDKAYAERAMKRYWQRYGATTDEQRARMHNGGPRGPKRKSTLGYWRKVQKEMAQ